MYVYVAYMGLNNIDSNFLRGHACMKTGHVMLMADVIVDTKLTCMYISTDAIVDI